uniref:Uncharacterized protein n=1 Tax=Oryza brachyantha TaxID=4533 RepID=J3ND58_ORYBR
MAQRFPGDLFLLNLRRLANTASATTTSFSHTTLGFSMAWKALGTSKIYSVFFDLPDYAFA